MTTSDTTSRSPLAEALIGEMKNTFGSDTRRINHALEVLGYAQAIAAGEGGADADVVAAAAILHDIGIQEAERKHHSSAGHYQEIEGPPIAREILRRHGLNAGRLDHVLRIIASHHSANDIDTPEFRIIWDADRLANIPEECAGKTRPQLEQFIAKRYRTAAGKALAVARLRADAGETDPSPAGDSSGDFLGQIERFVADYGLIAAEIQKVIVGHQQVVEQVLDCLLSGGHALLEGVPGLGKTLLVRTLGDALDLSFSRIQFTPDLMPSDITGTNIVVADEHGSKSFRFQGGPIFANLVLADEINRATPKTQSAVLEAMQEQTVSVARVTHKLAAPFFVLATQNPLEMEGTYPLPEAQLDRFMFKIKVSSPSAGELVTIMDRTAGPAAPKAQHVATAERIVEMQSLVRQVAAAASVKEFIASVILATHPGHPQSPAAARKYVRYGASPRGAQAILLGARVRALRQGRANVSLDDVRQVAPAALRHRLILSFEGLAEGIDPEQIIQEALRNQPAK